MVIWPAFRMGQYCVNDHPYHAPQFNTVIWSAKTKYFSLLSGNVKFLNCEKMTMWFSYVYQRQNKPYHMAHMLEFFSIKPPTHYVGGYNFKFQRRSFEIWKYYFSGNNALNINLYVLKLVDFVQNLKWGGFCRWSFRPIFVRGSIETTTMRKLGHPLVGHP